MLPKIATDMAVMIIVFMLLPSHTIKIGAIADFGRLFKITKYGSKISLNVVFHHKKTYGGNEKKTAERLCKCDANVF